MSDQEKTPEQVKAELESRVKGFNAELIPLLKKYRLGLGAQPVFMTDGRVAARPQVFDDSKSFDKDGEPIKAQDTPAPKVEGDKIATA